MKNKDKLEKHKIGYSVHSIEEYLHVLPRLKDIARIKPIQLYVSETIYNDYINIFEEAIHLMDVKIWGIDEFDSKEEIFLLE